MFYNEFQMEPAFNVPLDAHMLGCTSCVSFENKCDASCFSSAMPAKRTIAEAERRLFLHGLWTLIKEWLKNDVFVKARAFISRATSVHLFGAEYGSWGHEEGEAEFKQSQSRDRETTRE